MMPPEKGSPRYSLPFLSRRSRRPARHEGVVLYPWAHLTKRQLCGLAQRLGGKPELQSDGSVLEGVGTTLAGRGWMTIGGLYDTSAVSGTLDAYLKCFINRATAGWVAALLERAGVVQIDRGRLRSVLPPR